jgi:hypothetical protein
MRNTDTTKAECGAPPHTPAAHQRSGGNDAKKGIAWYNAMNEEDRRFWLCAALTAVPAEAWTYYQRVTAD